MYMYSGTLAGSKYTAKIIITSTCSVGPDPPRLPILDTPLAWATKECHSIN